MGLSVISLAELYEGVYGSRQPEQSEAGLEAFLRGVTLVEIDQETCRLFGRVSCLSRKVTASAL